jgi:type III secretion protein T
MGAAGLSWATQAVVQWGALVLLFGIRPLVALSVLPATADPMLPATVRSQLAMVYAGFVATGAFLGGQQVALSLPGLLLLSLREGLIGLTLGCAGARVMWMAESMGALVDNMAGYNNIQLLNPSRTEQSTPLSDLMLQLVVVLVWSLGGMLVFFSVLNQTFLWWPLLAARPDWPDLSLAQGLDAFTQLMRWITAVSMPVLFLIAAIDIGLGLVSRVAKKVDTSAVGQPLKAAVALLSLSLFASVFAQDVQGYLALGDLTDWMQRWRGAP